MTDEELQQRFDSLAKTIEIQFQIILDLWGHIHGLASLLETKGVLPFGSLQSAAEEARNAFLRRHSQSQKEIDKTQQLLRNE